MSETTPSNQLNPDKLLEILPELLASMRTLAATSLHVQPDKKGGFSISVIRDHPYYVSKRELAALLPKFSEKTDGERFVDKLVALGMPVAAPTGTPIFNLAICMKWLDNWQRSTQRSRKSE